ncbi:MAG TPA: serpin family protein, partial [Longimicrobiales bacterium]|nr:serpin family protein [Longimicrobiales bacterium]
LPLMVLLAACGDGTGPEVPKITQLPRPLTASEEQVIASANAFGVDLMAEVLARDDRPNVILSPLSASVALGMTLNGAAGSTFDDMRTALRFGSLSQGEINAAYRGLVDLLLGLDPSVELSIANATFANEGWPFHPSFFDSVSTYFDATAESRDFADPATVQAINAWAKEHTEGRIEKILDQLDPDMVMILLDAIWFDGRWTTQFDPEDTRPASFRRADDSQVTVEMMHLGDVELPFGGASGLAAVELPYGGEAWSMLVAVPWGSEPVRDVVAGMDQGDWNALVSSLQVQDVDDVALPKFELSYDVFLNDPLTDMGMGVAFTPAADFTNLSPRGDELCIDFVRQKTFIEVDEAGTRAAAVTAVGIGPVSFTGLIADRPFLFAIRERLSGTILFMGIVGDPALEDAGPAEAGDGCEPG